MSAQHRIERLDRLQQPDRRGGVDGQGLDHPGLPSLQVDRAVNVDALMRTIRRDLDRFHLDPSISMPWPGRGAARLTAC
jgi:hypothetical protein